MKLYTEENPYYRNGEILNPPPSPGHHSDKWNLTVEWTVIFLTVSLSLGHLIVLWFAPRYGVILTVTFAWFAFTVFAAQSYRPGAKVTPSAERKTVAVFMAIRECDPAHLKRSLDSVLTQSHLPVAVYVLENGSHSPDAKAIFDEWNEARQRNWHERKDGQRIERATFISRPQLNKREVLYLASLEEAAYGTEVIATVDGYSVLETHAVENGARRFANPRVMAVAGLLVAINHDKNFRSRMLDMSFVTGMVVDRAAQSRYNAVASTRGGLAFYRAEKVFGEHGLEYVNQTVPSFRRNPVHDLTVVDGAVIADKHVSDIRRKFLSSGDDRSATGFAGLHGDTVFEKTSVAHTLVSESLSKASARQSRWWRTLWLGSIWILLHHSPRKAIWWLTAGQITAFTLQAIVTPMILITEPLMVGGLYAAYLMVLSYIKSARTLTLKRPGQSLRRQVAMFTVVAPASAMLDLWLNVWLFWWGGAITPHITTWTPHQVHAKTGK